MIHTDLRDQRDSQPRFSPPPGIELRIAQQFSQNHRGHNNQLVGRGSIQQVCILAALPLQEGDPGARVG